VAAAGRAGAGVRAALRRTGACRGSALRIGEPDPRHRGRAGIAVREPDARAGRAEGTAEHPLVRDHLRARDRPGRRHGVHGHLPARDLRAPAVRGLGDRGRPGPRGVGARLRNAAGGCGVVTPNLMSTRIPRLALRRRPTAARLLADSTPGQGFDLLALNVVVALEELDERTPAVFIPRAARGGSRVSLNLGLALAQHVDVTLL